ncbi:unnamed protein product [Adineta ricciae]|uniref:LIM zinc-binding domain-containing protein n=1 Tax=Adineta ricciae TaxID=249248 RepID=A0A814HGE6_ADIRI|nr:unnamed protein product [Adineta ricciae]
MMDERRVKKLTEQLSYNRQMYREEVECFYCNVCRRGITDEFYLRAGPKIYHEACLQCSVCQQHLDEQSTCFFKGTRIVCRQDYYRYFVHKCPKCDRLISPNDWIRRACDYVYHLTCFACYTCERQLSTGEEYSLDNGHILCKTHVIDGNDDKNDDQKQNRTKRIRTAFSEEQLQVLQASFEIDQNPDGQELEHISQIIEHSSSTEEDPHREHDRLVVVVIVQFQTTVKRTDIDMHQVALLRRKDRLQ